MIVNKRASRHGFTLIELVVVIVMIGVLAGMVIPRLPDVIHKRAGEAYT